MSASVSGAYASAHLPECTLPKGWGDCICGELRACEQRVIAEREADGPWFRSVVHDCCVDKQTAYVAGLDAAREAIKASVLVWEATDDYTYGLRDAVAAIDGLRGES